MRTKVLLWLLLLGVCSVTATEKVVRFRAETIMCGGCVAEIKEVVKALDGVLDCTADQESKVVVITYDDTKVTPSKFRQAIASKGHSVEDYKPVVVPREIFYWTPDLKSEVYATQTLQSVSATEGVLSVTPDLAKRMIRIEYNAEAINSKGLKKALVAAGLSVAKHWDSVRGKSVTFRPTRLLDQLDALESGMAAIPVRDGVWDSSLNRTTLELTVTFDIEFTSVEALQKKFADYGLEVFSIEN